MNGASGFPRSLRALATLTVLLLVLLLAGASAPLVSAVEPANPLITPSTDLDDRQWVRVDWTGFPQAPPGPDEIQEELIYVVILQCRDLTTPAEAGDTRSQADRNCLPREDVTRNDFAPERFEAATVASDGVVSRGPTNLVPLAPAVIAQTSGSGSQMFRARISKPECSDGIDNDQDGEADFGTDSSADPQCSRADDGNESPTDDRDYSTFYCDSEHQCNLVVIPYDALASTYRDPSVDLPNKNEHIEDNLIRAKVAPLEFAAPLDCGEADSSLLGLGDPSIRLAGVRWQPEVCSALSIAPVIVSRTSFAAVADFLEQDEDDPTDDVDFVVSTVPLTAEERAALAEKNIRFTVVPVAVSGLSLAFNYRNQTTRMFNLRLTPKAAAVKVLEAPFGQEFIDMQEVPTPSYGGGPTNTQVGFVAANRILTSWLASDPEATAFWNATPGARELPIPTDILPATIDIFRVSGEDFGADLMARLQAGNGSSAIGQRVGYMYSSTANFFGLQSAKIPNRNPMVIEGPAPDFEFVAPTVESMTKSVEASLAKEAADKAAGKPEAQDEFLDIDYGTAAPGAYPMPVVSYMVVRTDLARKSEEGIKKSSDLKKYLQYILADGQKNLPIGYAPLPAALVAQGTAALEDFQEPRTPKVPKETTTTTTEPEETEETVVAAASATTTTSAPASAPLRSSTTTTRGTTTTTVPPAEAGSEENGDPEEEFFDEEPLLEEEFEEFFEEEAEPEASQELLANSVPLGTPEQQVANVEALPPRNFPERVAAIVGKLQGSRSRLLLPSLLLIGLLALVVGSARNVPEVLKGWNPAFESDALRRLRGVVDTWFEKR